MKRILSFAILSFALMAPVSAQTATEVLNKYIEAVGGRDAWEAVSSTHQKISVSVEIPQGVIVLDVEAWNIYPGYMAATQTLVSAPDGIPDISNRMFISPENSWMESAQGRQDITGNVAGALGGNAPALEQPLTEIDILASMDSVTVEMTGQEDIKGKPAYVISIDGDSPSKRFYDVESGLLVATEAAGPMGPMQMKISEYQDFDGLLKAFIQEGTMGPGTQTQALTLFEVDLDLTAEDLLALVDSGADN
jgi:hypothetical protein